MSNVVHDALLRYLPPDRRRTPGGWTSINGVCCIHNGESRPDSRRRAGFRLTEDNISVYHCLNCKFKASWTPGWKLSHRMENLLRWTGIGTDEFKKLAFRVWQLKEQVQADIPVREFTRLEFAAASLPQNAQPFSHWLSQPEINPDFLRVAQYMAERGDAVLGGYEYYWTPDKRKNLCQRAIIPFRWKGETVGYTARAIFPTKERYYGDAPLNYLFNTESIQDNHRFIIVNEGVLDAVAVNGVGTMGDKLNDNQCNWLNQTGKQIIVMPDREREGGALVDIALRQGWHVSFPRWDKGVKDAAAATQRYGKLYTLWSIIDARTNNRLEINVKRKMDLK